MLTNEQPRMLSESEQKALRFAGIYTTYEEYESSESWCRVCVGCNSGLLQSGHHEQGCPIYKAIEALEDALENYPNCPECGSEPRCEDAPQCKTCGGNHSDPIPQVVEPANSTSSVVEPNIENRLHKWQGLTDQETIELAYKNKGADGIVVWALFAKDFEDALKKKNQ